MNRRTALLLCVLLPMGLAGCIIADEGGYRREGEGYRRGDEGRYGGREERHEREERGERRGERDR